jgi:hypothetical protein
MTENKRGSSAKNKLSDNYNNLELHVEHLKDEDLAPQYLNRKSHINPHDELAKGALELK